MDAFVGHYQASIPKSTLDPSPVTASPGPRRGLLSILANSHRVTRTPEGSPIDSYNSHRVTRTPEGSPLDCYNSHRVTRTQEGSPIDSYNSHRVTRTPEGSPVDSCQHPPIRLF